MNWLHTPMAAALGRALLHFIWEGALIAALLGVVLAALRRAPAQARYLAACAAMAAMAASFAVTALTPGAEGARFAPVFPSAFLLAPGGGNTSAWAATPRPLTTWAVAIWLAGVIVLLARRAGGWLAARRMVSRGAVAADPRWSALLDRARTRAGIARAVTLVESARAATPAVIGWLRPVILAPAGWLLCLPPEQAETVLLHELAHIRRHDYLVNLLASAVEDVLFYHPAVWWVGRVIRRERENCCDDLVIEWGGDRRSYARTLASLEGLRAGEPALAASGGSLADRIRRLLAPPEGPRASAVPLLAAMALVCAGAVALPAWQAPAPQARPEVSNPYEKWLNEDVAYIIEDRERAAFKSLRTNEEREHFIEQFWLRRDPTPGTVENEFKEEHYRRIAYTNEHFADPTLPGWKTDRGRIYIVYGPPDEKESHPSGDRGGPPYEEWRYRLIQGIGKDVIVRFVDENRDGRYRMTRDPAVLHGQVAAPHSPPAAAPAELPLPPDQPNGDYLYQAGDASVRIGQGGATMITVGAAKVTVSLTRQETGEVVFRESWGIRSGDGYTKLLTLPRGTYRLEAEKEGRRRPGPRQLAEMQERLLTALREARQRSVADGQSLPFVTLPNTRQMPPATAASAAPEVTRLDFRVR
ncbi:MAG: GWxTD domain-containing protein [Acidobacteria bacterium]|nr:GWxTD domain-containing protein [Acidobacteriota bacterium]